MFKKIRSYTYKLKRNKMIVTTDYAYESGKGTSMFSKNGRLTSYQYKVFTDPVDGYKKAPIDHSKMPISQELIGNNEYLPLIL